MVSWEQLHKNFDKRLDLEEIDEFQLHLNKAVDKKIKKLELEFDNITEDDVEDPEYFMDYKEQLNEGMMLTYSAKLLGFELRIIALYKKIEIKLKKVIEHKVSDPRSLNFSFIRNVKKVIDFEIEDVNGYESFNELRLINNAIKHGGYVSKELSDIYPNWKSDDELKDLDKAYDRLLPGVTNYVSDFVEKIYTTSQS